MLKEKHLGNYANNSTLILFFTFIPAWILKRINTKNISQWYSDPKRHKNKKSLYIL